jgi:putative hydrolase of the HAD superfamily
VLLPGAREALEAVRRRGYKMGLICNTGRTPGSTLRKLMDRMGILGFFDVTTFSNEIMVRKPSEAAFRTTLKELGAAPKASVHVGDNPENDIAGAKRVGMRALQVMQYANRPAPEADARIESIVGLPEVLGKFSQ